MNRNVRFIEMQRLEKIGFFSIDAIRKREIQLYNLYFKDKQPLSDLVDSVDDYIGQSINFNDAEMDAEEIATNDEKRIAEFMEMVKYNFVNGIATDFDFAALDDKQADFLHLIPENDDLEEEYFEERAKFSLTKSKYGRTESKRKEEEYFDH